MSRPASPVGSLINDGQCTTWSVYATRIWRNMMTSSRKTLAWPTPACQPIVSIIVLSLGLAAGSALAQHVPGESVTEAHRETVAERFEGRGYSPYGGRHFPTRPLFGDTHLHTNLRTSPGKQETGTMRMSQLDSDFAEHQIAKDT